MVQRSYFLPTLEFESMHPNQRYAVQWNSWKRECINSITIQRKALLRSITELCDDGLPIDPSALVIKSEEDLIARLEARIIRSKNFPLQEA
jgi:hypothetical protein